MFLYFSYQLSYNCSPYNSFWHLDLEQIVLQSIDVFGVHEVFSTYSRTSSGNVKMILNGSSTTENLLSILCILHVSCFSAFFH